jgi:hypothetical protein
MTSIITASELEYLDETELRVKLHHIWQDLIRTEQGSQERAQAVASLENIEQALCRRLFDWSKP